MLNGYIRNWLNYNKTGFTVIVVAIIAALAGISFWSGFLLGSSNHTTVSERQTVDEVRHLMPPALNGLPVGVMFDSISTHRYWWTHTATEERFLLPNRVTTWVHFFGETEKGYMHASINLDRNKGKVVYHLFVNTQPVRLNDLYDMFRRQEEN